MKFRIKKVEGYGFFAQVETTGFFGIFKEWYTIGSHGYTILSEDNIEYPVSSREDAINVVTQYKKSLELKKIEYFEIE